MRPTVQLVISMAAPTHHALSKKVQPKERYMNRDEAFILGTLKDQTNDSLLVIMEPKRGDMGITSATQRAIQLFNPHYAFFLGTAEGAPGQNHGDVVISNQLMTGEDAEGSWIYGHTDQHLAQYLDNLENNDKPSSPFHIGRLIGNEDSLLRAQQMYPGAHWAIAPQAEGFFTALKSSPMVSSLAILGICQPQIAQDTFDETTVDPCEKAVDAALDLWRHMEEVRI